MGDAAHLRVRGGVTVILWRQEGTRMQALTCTAQQVSGEKNGELCPSKGTNRHCILAGGGGTCSQMRPRGLQAISEGPSVAILDWCHRWRAVAPTLSLPHHHAGGGRRAWNGNVETPLTFYYFIYITYYL